MRLFAALTVLVSVTFALAGCGPTYSPDTYASNAAQQANKVEEGVIAGVRPVQISAQGTVGGVAGAAAGGVAGSQVGTGTASAFAAIGGSLLGGVAGVATEHIIGDTNGFEYIVRKANGDMLSVAQKDEKPLRVGQKVLVIAGPQARIVPDYTVPFDAPPKTAAKPPAASTPEASAHKPVETATPDASGHKPAEAAQPELPVVTATPLQVPEAFESPHASGGAVPPVIVPPESEPPKPQPP